MRLLCRDSVVVSSAAALGVQLVPLPRLVSPPDLHLLLRSSTRPTCYGDVEPVHPRSFCRSLEGSKANRSQGWNDIRCHVPRPIVRSRRSRPRDRVVSPVNTMSASNRLLKIPGARLLTIRVQGARLAGPLLGSSRDSGAPNATWMLALLSVGAHCSTACRKCPLAPAAPGDRPMRPLLRLLRRASAQNYSG